VAEFEPTQTSKNLLQLNNQFSELREFEWRNPRLWMRLNQNDIDKVVMNKIKAQYIDCIKNYFQRIENKAKEFEHFETYCHSYERRVDKEKKRNAYPIPIVHFGNYLDEILVHLKVLEVEIYQLVRKEQQRQDNAVETASTKTKILFLTANPRDQQSLRLEGELRKVLDTLSGATYKNSLDYKIEPAVRIDIITKAMQTEKPEIVHFSGHGCVEGLAVEDDSGYSDLFPIEGLDKMFGLFKKTIKCVILNACDSKELAKIISKHGIHVVGMNDEIGDEAARKFAVGFYQGLGEGNTYEFAFKMGMIHISNEYDDANTPELWFNGERIKN